MDTRYSRAASALILISFAVAASGCQQDESAVTEEPQSASVSETRTADYRKSGAYHHDGFNFRNSIGKVFRRVQHEQTRC